MNQIRRKAAALVLLFLLLLPASVSADSFDHEYTLLNALLKRVVHQEGARSTVDYTLLKEQTGQLTAVIDDFTSVSYKEFTTFNPDQKLAFLLNAYNVFTLQLVAQQYPVDSIKDIGGSKGPWKQSFISLLDKRYSLDKLEHGLIREKFKDPRIHFALVCAAKSCPALQQKAYRGSILDSQLEDAAVAFIRDTGRNRFDKATNTLYLSTIFSWFAEDFGGNNGVTFFVAHRLEDVTETDVLTARVEYLPYDWSLNDYTS